MRGRRQLFFVCDVYILHFLSTVIRSNFSRSRCHLLTMTYMLWIVGAATNAAIITCSVSWRNKYITQRQHCLASVIPQQVWIDRAKRDLAARHDTNVLEYDDSPKLSVQCGFFTSSVRLTVTYPFQHRIAGNSHMSDDYIHHVMDLSTESVHILDEHVSAVSRQVSLPSLDQPGHVGHLVPAIGLATIEQQWQEWKQRVDRNFSQQVDVNIQADVLDRTLATAVHTFTDQSKQVKRLFV